MEEEEEAPPLFRCPISMELMHSPVTISTGVTYERKNIEKWLFTYKKSTCPATMQPLQSFNLTPNTTLSNLIQSWLQYQQPPPSPTPTPELEKLLSLLATIDSSPFKVTPLKNLQSLIQTSHDQVRKDFVTSGSIQVLSKIIAQVSVEGADFAAFRACEESLAVLHRLPLSDKAASELLSKPEYMSSLMLVLQRGTAEARLNTMSVLQKLSATTKDWMQVNQELIKSLLELLSDEISTKLSSCSLDILIEIMTASTKNRQKAVEAGAVCILIELLPDSNRQKCEKMLFLLLKLCERPEGRSAFIGHGLGIAAVSKKILRVSELGTKLGVKILWLVCSFTPKEKVIIDDMMVFGAVRKLIRLLHADGRSSTKEKAVKMLKLHGGVWMQCACFPSELEYLKVFEITRP